MAFSNITIEQLLGVYGSFSNITIEQSIRRVWLFLI